MYPQDDRKQNLEGSTSQVQTNFKIRYQPRDKSKWILIFDRYHKEILFSGAIFDSPDSQGVCPQSQLLKRMVVFLFDFIANFSYSRMWPVICRITCNDIRLTFAMNSSVSLTLMYFPASFVMALQIAVIALSSSLLESRKFF